MTAKSYKNHTLQRINKQDLQSNIRELESLCAVNSSPRKHIANSNATKAFKCLKKIMNHTDRVALQNIEDLSPIVKCTIILMHGFVTNYKVKRSFFEKLGKRPFAEAEHYFNKMLEMLMPECIPVLDIIIEFLSNDKLWKFEFFSSKILMSTLENGVSSKLLMTKMLDNIENLLKNKDIQDARHLVKILHSIICNNLFWTNLLAGDIERLIKIIHQGVTKESQENYVYFEMRRGFEMCLRKVLEVVKSTVLVEVVNSLTYSTFSTDLSDTEMMDFGNNLEFATMFLRNIKISEAIQPKIMEFLLQKMASSSKSQCSFACTILSRLLDHNDNFDEFIEPKIFFHNTSYKITISEVFEKDKKFLRAFKYQIENSILNIIKTHPTFDVTLIYSILCLISVSCPCGFVVDLVIKILMEIQKYCIEECEEMEENLFNSLNAIVISVMTLICWIHRATSLTKYVQLLVKSRYDEAAHLNPPLKVDYQQARYHVFWHKNELFLDTWELRYCLLQKFRLHEETLPLPIQGAFKLEQSPSHLYLH